MIRFFLCLSHVRCALCSHRTSYPHSSWNLCGLRSYLVLSLLWKTHLFKVRSGSLQSFYLIFHYTHSLSPFFYLFIIIFPLFSNIILFLTLFVYDLYFLYFYNIFFICIYKTHLQISFFLFKFLNKILYY